MASALVAAIERWVTLGIDERSSPGDQRRIRLTNQSALIGSLSCGSFAVAYAVAGPAFVRPMIANVIAVMCFLGALALGKMGARTAARLAILVPVNLVVVVASMLMGGRIGFLYYFILFAAVAFLLFSEKEWGYRLTLAGGSAACAVFSLVVAPPAASLGDLVTPRMALALDVVAANAVIGTVCLIVHLFTGDTARAEARLAEEHARSERLLLNILPAAISARLKDDEEIADGFAEVTVLFADIVGFTELSQELSPRALVEMLNRTFSAFDDLAIRLGLEKIKTIGDCYMVAGGLPERSDDHAERMAEMALGMREELARINREGGYSLALRIGIHTGPVVAGVIGKRKFIYDLWGDTVNTASRMESSGVAGEIQLSAATNRKLEPTYETSSRGVVKVKGKGEMETYFLKGPRSPTNAAH
jgi:class 3 adenylate cyclase